MHRCHANGCETPDLHPEAPFCKRHWAMLPKPHQQKLWRARARGACGVCEHDEAHPSFTELVNLGIALLCVLEYGEHDCPGSLIDKQGFCWGCGCHDAAKVYQQVTTIMEKFGLKGRA